MRIKITHALSLLDIIQRFDLSSLPDERPLGKVLC